MITLKRFRRLERALLNAGHGDDTGWAERLRPPGHADEFAKAAVYVIVNSGMSYLAARNIYDRCLEGLQRRGSTRRVFRHKAKAKAIDTIWRERERLFAELAASDDQVEFCQSLPWIGPVTKYHLAKEIGIDVAKPDVHLARLAAKDRISVERMCKRLARLTGYRVATIDTILWRACATGILDSKRYEEEGWRAAFRGMPKIEH